MNKHPDKEMSGLYCSHCMSAIPDGSQFCEFCHHRPTVTAAPHQLAAGTILNRRYLIGKVIGEGGFGITYVALDLNLEMKVAVKEFYPHGFANRSNTVTNKVTMNYTEETPYFNDAKQRFLQEAKSIAKFSSESAVVDVRDYFTENNTAYIVMEYLEGITLADYIRQHGVFSADDIFTRMLPLMDSLSVMHNQAIIHRDISPDNIMMIANGSLKLMDFGSARYYEGEKKHTMSILLKPGYVPVEQYSKTTAQGPWTDVYGLCATIYKCITGKTPVESMARCQTDRLKPPSELGVAIQPALESVLMNGLGVYPEDRIQNMPMLKAAVINARSCGADGKADTLRPVPVYGDSFNRSDEVTRQKKNNKTPIIIGAVAFLAVAAIVAGIIFIPGLFKNSDKTSSASQTSTQQSTQQTTATEETAAEETGAETRGSTGSDEEADVVYVPKVEGKKLADAERQLAALGIKVKVVYEESDTVAAGYVIRQGGGVGKSLAKGETLVLYVSSGKPKEKRPKKDPVEEEITEEPTEELTEEQTEAPTEETTEEATDPEFPDTPYLIKVFPDVDVYESPDANSAITETITEEGVYTIVEEKTDGYGRWGKLKSGAGWICVSDILDAGGYYVEE